EVAQGYGLRSIPIIRFAEFKGNRPEDAVAVAQQHRDGAARRAIARACHYQVRYAVIVEITHCYGRRIRSRTVVGGSQEDPIAIAEQHHESVLTVSRRQVQLAIAVEVPYRQETRVRVPPRRETMIRPRTVVVSGPEGAIAVAQQHRDAAIAGPASVALVE